MKIVTTSNIFKENVKQSANHSVASQNVSDICQKSMSHRFDSSKKHLVKCFLHYVSEIYQMLNFNRFLTASYCQCFPKYFASSDGNVLEKF